MIVQTPGITRIPGVFLFDGPAVIKTEMRMIAGGVIIFMKEGHDLL